MTARRVLVVGGGSGIGLATVQALVEAGDQVAVIDIVLNRLPDALPVTRIVADVTNEEQVCSAVTQAKISLGGFDAVIHVAGIMREQGRDLREISLDSWRTVINVNLTGPFLVARETVRVMADEGGGTLILVGSGAGTTGPSGSIPYGASKGGVNGLAMTLGRHLEPLNIRVHNFMPGSVDTPLIQRSLDERISNGGAVAETEAARSGLTDPAKVGRVLAFLASADADAVKGNVSTR